MRVALFALFALFVLFVGCAQDPAPYAPLEGSRANGSLVGRGGTNIFGDEVPTDPDELWVSDPDIYGNVGSVEVYGGGRIADGYVLADYAYVELRDEGTTGALMLAFNISGLDRIVPGAYRFSREGVEFPDGMELGSVQITAIGCSGAREGMWTFDRPGEQLDVEVSEGSNANELRFEIEGELATYTTERSNVTAGFTIRRVEEAAP